MSYPKIMRCNDFQYHRRLSYITSRKSTVSCILTVFLRRMHKIKTIDHSWKFMSLFMCIIQSLNITCSRFAQIFFVKNFINTYAKMIYTLIYDHLSYFKYPYVVSNVIPYPKYLNGVTYFCITLKPILSITNCLCLKYSYHTSKRLKHY